MKKKLLWINPVGHNVYKGWMYLFDKYFDLDIYDLYDPYEYGNHHKLEVIKTIMTKTNPICIFNKNTINISKDTFVIVGDIFTNTLCYTIRGNNVAYYSEFFAHKKSRFKIFMFYFLGLIFFRNKKIIVPTVLANTTFSNISNNIFYLPQIYTGNIFKPKNREDEYIKLLFVGRMSQQFKNINFLIENFIELKKSCSQITLTLVGSIEDKNFMEKYGNLFRDGEIEYLGVKKNEELDKVYSDHDIFILPSNSDPIGAVVLEAMAHGIAILTTDTVGASSYVENNQNGFIFEANNSEDFKNKLSILIKDRGILKEFKNKSYELTRNKYWYGNDELITNIKASFTEFIYKK